jgi:hypothetical protein
MQLRHVRQVFAGQLLPNTSSDKQLSKLQILEHDDEIWRELMV